MGSGLWLQTGERVYKLHVLMEDCKLKVKQEADERKKRYIAVRDKGIDFTICTTNTSLECKRRR